MRLQLFHPLTRMVLSLRNLYIRWSQSIIKDSSKQIKIISKQWHILGMAERGIMGMTGEMALSTSSSLGSNRWGKRVVSSPSWLSGEDAGTMLSGASLSSSLSILSWKNPLVHWHMHKFMISCSYRIIFGNLPYIFVLVVRWSGESCKYVYTLYFLWNRTFKYKI